MEFGLDYESLHARFPQLVYAQVTGYGPDTEARDTAAYDIGAFWSQAGVGMSLTAPGGDIPQQRGGMGDHMTGQMTAGAICAALYNREKTGRGPARVGAARSGGRVHVRVGRHAGTAPGHAHPFVRPLSRGEPDHRLLQVGGRQVVLASPASGGPTLGRPLPGDWPRRPDGERAVQEHRGAPNQRPGAGRGTGRGLRD